MPSSYLEQIPIIIHVIRRLRPLSLLDIGVGFGKYGFLAREYLEIWGSNNDYGHFSVRIDGVEPFKSYITPCHSFIYDNIYNVDALTFVKKQTTEYDLVLLIDVLEHLEKEKGKVLISSLLENNRNVLISTPKVFHKQDAVYQNPYEVHRSLWKEKELLRFGNGIIIPFKWSFIVLLGKDWTMFRRYRLKRQILRLLPEFIQDFLESKLLINKG